METAPTAIDRKRIRRRTLLIDRRYQLKYTFILVLVGIVVSAILGYFITSLSLENTKLLKMDPDLQQLAAQYDNYAVYMLVGFVVLMALCLFVIGLIITHKVAGPIFIISRYLRQIGEGTVPKTRPLRRGDELKEFFETFSLMLESLKRRHLEEAEAIEKAAAAMRAKGGDLADAAKALEELAARKRAWGQEAGEL